MFDIRPVGYVIGLIVTFLGVSMLVPMGVDLALANGEWGVFAESAAISVFIGLALVFSCANGVQQGLSLQQTFLLTTAIWAILPIFAALPFVFGATDARIVDAVFEAMSGLTTTGSTVFTG